MKTFFENAAFAFIFLGATNLFGGTPISQVVWPVEIHDHMDGNYTIHDFNYIAGGRDPLVVMRGSSGGTDQENFALKVAEEASAPSLLGIAPQAKRNQGGGGRKNKSYSLADAMRDAIWRKRTGTKLKNLMGAQSACAGGAVGTSRDAPPIGLGAIC